MNTLPDQSKRLSQKTIGQVLKILAATYPEAHCELNYQTPFQLLIATVKKVNEVTSILFKNYATAQDFLYLTQEQLEEYIRQIGLYRNKAKNILGLCHMLVTQYQGEVPNNFEDLVKLPGVGRKTANVVLSNAFGVPNRIGLTKAEDVNKTEVQLMESIPKDLWSKAHHLLIWHGRRTCTARNPQCQICPVQPNCLYFRKNKKAKDIC